MDFHRLTFPSDGEGPEGRSAAALEQCRRGKNGGAARRQLVNSGRREAIKIITNNILYEPIEVLEAGDVDALRGHVDGETLWRSLRLSPVQADRIHADRLCQSKVPSK